MSPLSLDTRCFIPIVKSKTICVLVYPLGLNTTRTPDEEPDGMSEGIDASAK